MQTILHSQQPEHKKINLYNSILEKVARHEKRLQTVNREQQKIEY